MAARYGAARTAPILQPAGEWHPFRSHPRLRVPRLVIPATVRNDAWFLRPICDRTVTRRDYSLIISMVLKRSNISRPETAQLYLATA
jgi:hypothetical protein